MIEKFKCPKCGHIITYTSNNGGSGCSHVSCDNCKKRVALIFNPVSCLACRFNPIGGCISVTRLIAIKE